MKEYKMAYKKYLVLIIFLAGTFFGCIPKGTNSQKMEGKMDYFIETENGEIIGDIDNTRIIDEINRIASEHIKPSEDYGFLILTPKVNINSLQYIQMAKNVGSNEYTVEIRIGDNEKFKHYQYFSNNKEEVISIFLNFTNDKKLPNLQKWADVSDQYR